MGMSFGGYLLRTAGAFAAVLALAWAYVALFPMAFLPGGYPAWAAKSAMLRACEVGNVAFFGDSRLESGVMPDLLPVAAANFGLAAGTTLELHSGVRRALACPVPPSQVVISLVPEHFGPLDRNFWLNALLYGFVTLPELLDIETLAAEMEDDATLGIADTPDGLRGRLRDWAYAVGLPPLHFASLVQGRIFGRAAANQARLAEVLQARGFSEYPQAEAAAADDPPFAVTRVHAAMFDRTLTMLRQRGVGVLLMTMPAAARTPAAPSEAAYLAFLRDAAARFPGTALLTDEVPRWPAALFADGAHLNRPGARLLSQKLASCFADGRLQPDCDLSWRAQDALPRP